MNSQDLLYKKKYLKYKKKYLELKKQLMGGAKDLDELLTEINEKNEFLKNQLSEIKKGKHTELNNEEYATSLINIYLGYYVRYFTLSESELITKDTQIILSLITKGIIQIFEYFGRNSQRSIYFIKTMIDMDSNIRNLSDIFLSFLNLTDKNDITNVIHMGDNLLINLYGDIFIAHHTEENIKYCTKVLEIFNNSLNEDITRAIRIDLGEPQILYIQYLINALSSMHKQNIRSQQDIDRVRRERAESAIPKLPQIVEPLEESRLQRQRSISNPDLIHLGEEKRDSGLSRLSGSPSSISPVSSRSSGSPSVSPRSGRRSTGNFLSALIGRSPSPSPSPKYSSKKYTREEWVGKDTDKAEEEEEEEELSTITNIKNEQLEWGEAFDKRRGRHLIKENK
jgi:hypothetical protein